MNNLPFPHLTKNPRPLLGQNAIVTGASRGIGRAVAIALAMAGANVVVNYRQSVELAEDVVRECLQAGVRSVAIQADVSSAAQAQHLVEAATVNIGPPHILVNNAGISVTGLLMDMPEDEWDRLMNANLKAPFLVTKSVLPTMIANRYGRIINMSSIWGLAGGSFEVAYSASKGGLIALTKALAKEMAPSGITVNAVAPGAVETDMLAGFTPEDLAQFAEETPVGRLGLPEEIAQAVLFLALPASSFITGQVLSPNGGIFT